MNVANSTYRVILSFLFIFACLFLGAREIRAFNAYPSKIVIPSLQISLGIKPANIVFETWEVRQDGASYGEHSALPGNFGNTIIFSHALPELFGNLKNITEGETVHLFTDLDWFAYKVTKKEIVSPEQVEVLDKINNYQLILFTCIGPNDENRLVITSTLQANTSAFNP